MIPCIVYHRYFFEPLPPDNFSGAGARIASYNLSTIRSLLSRARFAVQSKWLSIVSWLKRSVWMCKRPAGVLFGSTFMISSTRHLASDLDGILIPGCHVHERIDGRPLAWQLLTNSWGRLWEKKSVQTCCSSRIWPMISSIASMISLVLNKTWAVLSQAELVVEHIVIVKRPDDLIPFIDQNLEPGSKILQPPIKLGIAIVQIGYRILIVQPHGFC